MTDVVGGTEVGGATVGGGVVAGGAVVVGTVEGGAGGTVEAGAGAGTSLKVTSLVGTVVPGAGAGAASVTGGDEKAATVVDGATVAGVVVVDVVSGAGDGGCPSPAACRPDTGTVERARGTEIWFGAAVARPCGRDASRETPAHTSQAEIVPTTRNRSAFIRKVLSVPCHQSRRRSDAPGRPNGALFPIACPER